MSDADDKLRAAASALREATRARSPRADTTRAQLLARHAKQKRRFFDAPRLLAAAAAFLVLFVAPSAWALYTGRAQRWIETLVESVTSAEPEPAEPSAPPPRREHAHRTPAPVDEPATPAPEAEVEAEEAITPDAIAVTGPVEPASEPALAEAAPPAPRAAPPEDTRERDERLTYQRAHALQFEAHDHAAAVAAYDAYLAQYPRGRFATEAGYNRAVSLAHAGRAAEAIRALTPFAEGAHGGYRQEEAAALLRALEPSAAP